MAFRRVALQEAFFAPGTQPFRVYGYGTSDPLEEVLRPAYFAVARGLLHSGELIYVSTAPRPVPVSGCPPNSSSFWSCCAGRSEAPHRCASSRTSAAQAIRQADSPRWHHLGRTLRWPRSSGAAAARPATAPRSLRDPAQGARRREFPALGRSASKIPRHFL
jgi:hypothetical protein